MKARLRTQSSAEILGRLVLSEADGEDQAVDSPAMLLQRRLDAAVAAAPWGGHVPPEVKPWPGAVRLGLLALGAAGSWVAVLAVARALI